MSVYIANFGQQNFYWDKCLANSTIALINEKGSFPFARDRNRKGFMDHCLNKLKTAKGAKPIPSVVGRWYNLSILFEETLDDLWIHRANDDLYWTVSALGTISQHETFDSFRDRDIIIRERPCTGWSNRDKTGRRLKWDALHPKAKHFLFTESTYQKLRDENAEYAKALIDGDDIVRDEFHAQATWKSLEQKSGKGAVTSFGPKQRTIFRMVETAVKTTNAADGRSVERVMKEKDFLFDSKEDLADHIDELWDGQGGECALTGLEMIPDGIEDKGWMRYSLDRIDSDGHYEAGNLQLVCMFANKWKSDMDNQTFIDLVEKLRS